MLDSKHLSISVLLLFFSQKEINCTLFTYYSLDCLSPYSMISVPDINYIFYKFCHKV